METNLPGIHFLNRGKVRDIYEVGNRLLIVATDRLSAFDVVLPTPIPDKGRVLTQLSLFWFNLLRDVIPNHVLTDGLPAGACGVPAHRSTAGRCSVNGQNLCRLNAWCAGICLARMERLSRGWESVRPLALPAGLRESERLPGSHFHACHQGYAGHDENISFDEAPARIGGELTERVRAVSLEITGARQPMPSPAGSSWADTKFEFGTRRRSIDLDR